jgi:hypothetical protein
MSRAKSGLLSHEPIPAVQARCEDPIDLAVGFPVKAMVLLLALSVALAGTTAGRWYGWGWGIAAAFLAAGVISVVLALFACMASGLNATD